LKSIDDLVEQKKAFIEEVNAFVSTDDVSAGMLAAKDKASFIETSLERYSAFRERSEALLAKQKELMEQLVSVNENFVAAKNVSSDPNADMRAKEINDLIFACRTYEEVEKNLTEGAQFYTTLQEKLVSFKSKCSDFALARKTEREELVARVSSASPQQIQQMTMQASVQPAAVQPVQQAQAQPATQQMQMQQMQQMQMQQMQKMQQMPMQQQATQQQMQMQQMQKMQQMPMQQQATTQQQMQMQQMQMQQMQQMQRMQVPVQQMPMQQMPMQQMRPQTITMQPVYVTSPQQLAQMQRLQMQQQSQKMRTGGQQIPTTQYYQMTGGVQYYPQMNAQQMNAQQIQFMMK